MSKFTNSDLSISVNILRVICNSQSHTGVSLYDCKEAVNTLKAGLETGCDFYLEFDGAEYRIIEDSVIWDIYRDEIRSIVEDCYDLNLDNIPAFVAFNIDWEITAQNCYVDGYGHTFSGYDGSEETYKNYWIFRTN